MFYDYGHGSILGITSIEFVENLKGVLFTQLLSRSRNKLLPICYKPGRKVFSGYLIGMHVVFPGIPVLTLGHTAGV